jgi:3'-5' exoribonuclease
MTFSTAEAIFEQALDYLDEPLKGLCFEVVMDLNFREGYGANKHHHNYKGGLFLHTAEVVQNCLAADALGLDMQVLITAAIFHDYLKIEEYGLDQKGELQYTEFKRMIGHIAGSFAEFAVSAQEAGVDKATILKVAHCILAHHGRPEWGSAITPQTPEALTLHWADCMSAFFENGTYKEKES